MEQETPQITPIPADKAKIWKIWKVMLILAGITAVEFIIALAIPSSLMSQPVKVYVYIILTLFKAFYIVGEFMHLSHEKKSLIWSILLPIAFIFFMMFIFIYQGQAIYNVLF